MAEVTVTGTIPAPVDRVWSILRDFGDLGWGGIEKTKLEGEGVGAVRSFTARGGVDIRERLESIDDLAHRLSYSIMEPSPVPWTGYLARIQLSPDGAHTRLEWSGRFEPKGVSEEQAGSIVRSIFENGIRGLARAVAP